MKKLTICIALLAVVAFAGNAAAATYKINLAGASAQADFWRKAGEAFLDDINCTAKFIAGSATNGIVRGTGCQWPNTGDNNEIMIGYLAIASDAGCTNAAGCQPISMCDPNTATWSTNFAAPGACPNNTSQAVHLGASDVPCECINQSSAGYPNGYAASSSGACVDTSGALPSFMGDPTGWTSYSYNMNMPATMQYFASVAVPFGFLVNDSVQAYQCVAPDVNNGNIAYDPRGNFCEPTGGFGANGPSADCQGYADCNEVTGLCAGGPNAGSACTTPADCPAALITATSCELRPVQNLSRIQIVQMFSGRVSKWTDLGPWFDVVAGHDRLPGRTGWQAKPTSTYVANDEIVLCMRHAGSGTHSTMENVVMRDDGALVATTNCANVFHYRSSSSLTDDCVNRFPGAIGYVDADKQLSRDNANTHYIKYQGVEANRSTIANCAYPFFAEQQTFVDTACTPAILQNLAAAMNTFAGDPANLTVANFGVTANFWATQDELLCSKGSTCGGCALLPRP